MTAGSLVTDRVLVGPLAFVGGVLARLRLLGTLPIGDVGARHVVFGFMWR